MIVIEPCELTDASDIELIPICESEDFLKDMHAYSILDEFYAFLEFDAFKSFEETRLYLNTLIDRSLSPKCQYWFIKLKNEQEIVGTIGLHSLNTLRLSAEIGYGVSPKFQGRGVFSNSLNLVLSHAFVTLGLNRIAAHTDSRNEASIKGLLRGGFFFEGLMRSYYRSVSGKYSDCSVFSKLSSEHKRGYD